VLFASSSLVVVVAAAAAAAAILHDDADNYGTNRTVTAGNECLVWFYSFNICISAIMTIQTVGHRFKSIPTNGPRFTVPGLPWWSPIQVLTEFDVP